MSVQPVRDQPDGAGDNSLALAERLLDYINEILVLPSAKPDSAPEEFRQLAKWPQVEAMLWCIRQMSASLAKGELDFTCRERGYVLGSLKGFQANLRHLTWQAQRIAGGEYNQRVNFMGDFSIAFNQMAEQLDQRINNLTCISEEYKNQSIRDPLTGLYNRAAFFSFVASEFFSGPQTLGASTLIIADIDKFKSINDTYGHLMGDEVLKAFADTLVKTLRPGDICARYGGEEFLIFLPGEPVQSGILVAERLRKAVEQMEIPLHDEETIKITSSFGVCEVEPLEPGQDLDSHLKSRIKLADDHLYTAKATGRNKVVTGPCLIRQ